MTGFGRGFGVGLSRRRRRDTFEISGDIFWYLFMGSFKIEQKFNAEALGQMREAVTDTTSNTYQHAIGRKALNLK